jgi:hypothetical protein
METVKLWSHPLDDSHCQKTLYTLIKNWRKDVSPDLNLPPMYTTTEQYGANEYVLDVIAHLTNLDETLNTQIKQAVEELQEIELREPNLEGREASNLRSAIEKYTKQKLGIEKPLRHANYIKDDIKYHPHKCACLTAPRNDLKRTLWNFLFPYAKSGKAGIFCYQVKWNGTCQGIVAQEKNHNSERGTNQLFSLTPTNTLTRALEPKPRKRGARATLYGTAGESTESGKGAQYSLQVVNGQQTDTYTWIAITEEVIAVALLKGDNFTKTAELLCWEDKPCAACLMEKHGAGIAGALILEGGSDISEEHVKELSGKLRGDGAKALLGQVLNTQGHITAREMLNLLEDALT